MTTKFIPFLVTMARGTTWRGRRVPTRGDMDGNSRGRSIPNTAVKPFSANGTCRETGWERRSLPGIKFKTRIIHPGFYFVLAKICWLKKDPESIFHRSFMFRVLVGNMITCMVSLDRWKNGPGFLFCDTVR